MEGNTYQLTVKIQIFPTLFNNTKGEAEYQLTLIRDRSKLEGTFVGTYNQQQISGRAIAYIHRPAITVRH